MQLGLSSSGSFDNLERFFRDASNKSWYRRLHSYGEEGVRALRSATPKETSETADGWSYRIVEGRERISIEWYNTHEVDGVNIAVIIQYGHGTGTGGWVEGRDYINPAMRPIFDKIESDVWKEVTK